LFKNTDFSVFSPRPGENPQLKIKNLPGNTIAPIKALKPAATPADTLSFSSKPVSKTENPEELLEKNPILLKIKQDFQKENIDVRTKEGVKKASDHLISLLAKHNAYTADHSHEVAGVATQFAKFMKLSPDDVEEVETAALLHDIGKIFTPKSILDNPNNLINVEKQVIDQHAVQGKELLEKLGLTKNKSFKNLAVLVGDHHSRISKFSPLSKKKTILELADVYNALTTKRSYKPALSPQKTIEIMKKIQKEKNWSPDIFNNFERFVNQKNVNKKTEMHLTKNPFDSTENVFV